jgi:hypothetical protein
MIKRAVLGILMLATTALPAHAGIKGPNPVVIDTVGREASGAMGDARNGTDNVSYLTCLVTAYNGSNYMGCSARTPSASIHCFSHDPSLVQAALAMTSDAYLDFTWDAQGNCTSLQVQVNSAYTPKQP